MQRPPEQLDAFGRSQVAHEASLEALDSVDTTALERLVLEDVVGFGARGCIADEVRALHPRHAYSSITARFANLERKGFIVRPGNRRPGHSGRNQSVIYAREFAP